MEKPSREAPRTPSAEATPGNDLASLLKRAHELRDLGYEAGPRLTKERDQLHAQLIAALFPEELRMKLLQEGLSMEPRVDAREKRVKVRARFYKGPTWRYSEPHSSREIIVRWSPEQAATISVIDEDAIAEVVPERPAPDTLEETARAIRELALNNLSFERTTAAE